MTDKARVAFNLLFLVPGVVGGSEEATVELLRTLADEPPDDIEYRLYALEPFAAAHPQLVQHFPTQLLRMRGKLKPLRVLAEGTWLTRTTRQDDVRLVHHAGGALPPGSHLPSVVTIHDLQPFDMPENFHPVKRAYLHRVVPRAVTKARLVLVHSEFVRHSVIDRFGVAPDRVRVILAGVRPHPPLTVSVDDVRRRYDLPERWFVYPAITYPHKNHVTLVRAFARMAATQRDVGLVLTGRAAGEEARLLHEIERLDLSGQVRRTGRIPRADLMGLMAGARGLAFPSRYEGFGLPVLEAMALGTPVLAAATTALPEVVGGAGLLADPDDVEAWAAALTQLLDDEERERWVKAGRERAAELSWSAAAASTAAAHRAVLADL